MTYDDFIQELEKLPSDKWTRLCDNGAIRFIHCDEPSTFCPLTAVAFNIFHIPYSVDGWSKAAKVLCIDVLYEVQRILDAADQNDLLPGHTKNYRNSILQAISHLELTP